MSFFSKLKQKLFSVKKTPLATALLVLFFVFFYPHTANGFVGESLVSGTLKLMLDFTIILLSIAETIFQWIVDANTMTAIIDNNAVYQTWRTVRDAFNIAFIMVLLFSAFATVFQVSKYNYKAVLQNLIIMALLVNFSYPIARFIVDVSNVIMYGFLQNMGGDASFVSVIEKSGVTEFSKTKSSSLVFLLFAIIFTFIFGMTLLIIAVLLVIRTITLAVYIMFSPIAFVGSILPGTKLASTGSEWWTKFMQTCFSGPIMVFMLFVANSLMIAVMGLRKGTLSKLAVRQAGGLEANLLQELIVNASFFSLPIVVLWIGIMEAQKSGLAGANAVVGAGVKAMKKFSGYNRGKKEFDDYSKERQTRKEESRWKPGKKFGEKVNNAQDKLVARGNKDSKAGKRYNKRTDEKNKKDIKEESEKHDGKTEAQLHVDTNALNATRTSTDTDITFNQKQADKIKNLSDSKVKEEAGKAKQALSRGTNFEKEMENHLKTLSVGSIGLSTDSSTGLGAVRPPNVTPANYSGKLTPNAIAMETARARAEQAALDKWIRDEKAVRLAQMRATIKEAEDRGKIK